MRISKGLLTSTLAVALAVWPGIALGQDANMNLVPWAIPPLPQGEVLTYGKQEGQTLEISVPRSGKLAPLAIWIDNSAEFGGDARTLEAGWLPISLYDHGWAVARVNHRADRKAGAAGVVSDLASAIATIAKSADRLRINSSRIVLFGFGSGGHYALLLGTNPEYLQAANVPFGSMRAIVGINAEGFDVPRRIREGSRFRARKYEAVFGKDAQLQRGLSPVAHLASPNVPAVLLYAAKDGPGEFAARAREIVQSLNAAGASAEVRLIGRNRDSASSALGAPQHPATQGLLAFLDTIED